MKLVKSHFVTFVVLFVIALEAIHIGLSLRSYKRVSVAVLFDDEARFLILRNSRGSFKGFWGVPGGKADRFESSKSAVVREIGEETSLILKDDDYRIVYSYHVDHGENQKYKISVYEHRFTYRPEVTLDPNEHSEFAWIRLEDMWQYNFMPKGDDVIRELYDRQI